MAPGTAVILYGTPFVPAQTSIGPVIAPGAAGTLVIVIVICALIEPQGPAGSALVNVNVTVPFKISLAPG